MAMNTRRPIVGVFDDRAAADRAVEALQSVGVNPDQIHVIGHAHTGGFWSALRHLFTGDEDTDDVSDLGLSQDEVNYYENERQAGHTVVAVNASGREPQVVDILRSNGAHDLNIQSGATSGANAPADPSKTNAPTNQSTTAATEAPVYDRANTKDTTSRADTASTTTGAAPITTGPGINVDSPPITTGTGSGINANPPTGTREQQVQANRESVQADTTDGGNRAANMPPPATDRGDMAANQNTVDETDQERTMRLREEQLQTEKQRVQTGDVKIERTVVEEQKTVNVPVSHEEVYIEHRDAPTDQVDTTPIGEGETIRVPVSEEQVNVTKMPVAREEITAGTREVQENQQVSDTVRREEARVVRQGDVNVQGDTDSADRGPENTSGRTP